METKSYIGEVQCENCNILFTKRIKITTKKHYCSVECKRADKTSYVSEWTDERRRTYSTMMSGQNNPNFANKWSDEQRKIQSESKTNQFKTNPAYAYKCGKSNRGIKFSEERIKSMHQHRSSDSYSHPHTEHSKKLIGIKSKEKWTDEYKINFRQKMEELGHWTPLDNINPYKTYYINSNWICSMIDFFDENALSNLKMFGIFSNKNTKGWVRDHIVPRKLGFEFNIPYQLLRHPVNLQFISHSKNISKGFNDRKLTDEEKQSIIHTLYKKITQFNGIWVEHQHCLSLVMSKEVV
jgi:hypothetical protein